MFRALLVGLVSIPALLHAWAGLRQMNGEQVAPAPEWSRTAPPEVALADATLRADPSVRLLLTRSLERVADAPVPPRPAGKDREEKDPLAGLARGQARLFNDAKWAVAVLQAVPNEEGKFEVEVEDLAQDPVFREGNLAEEVRRVRAGARELGKARNALAREMKKVARSWLSASGEKKALVAVDPSETTPAQEAAKELHDRVAGSRPSRLRADAEKVLREWNVLRGVLERAGRAASVPEQVGEISRACGSAGVPAEEGREAVLGLLREYLPASLPLDSEVILISKDATEKRVDRVDIEVRWKNDKEARIPLSADWSKSPNEFDFLPSGRYENKAKYFDPDPKARGGADYFVGIKPTPRSQAAKRYNEGRHGLPWTLAGLKNLQTSCRQHQIELARPELGGVWQKITALLEAAERHPEMFGSGGGR